MNTTVRQSRKNQSNSSHEYKIITKDSPDGRIFGHSSFFPLSIGTQFTTNELNQLHSFDDKPALIRPGGEMIWAKNGMYHRENDLPAFIDLTRDRREWYVHDKCHRVNGPAIEYDDRCYWYHSDHIVDPRKGLLRARDEGVDIGLFLFSADAYTREAAKHLLLGE